MKYFILGLMLASWSLSAMAQEEQLATEIELSKPKQQAFEFKLPEQGQGIDDLDINLQDLQQFETLSDAALAYQAYLAEDYTKARVLAAVSGADGDALGQFLFGILLDHGLGGVADPQNAVKWYREAANNGQNDAWLALAGMAFDNRGGLSASDGREFLLKSAKLGSPEAMIALGRGFVSGYGGQIDERQAERWFREAIAKGANDARVALADLLLSQNKDAAALALYKTAVFGGSADAAWKAGVLQADPDSPVYSPDNAGLQLQTSAEAGNAQAMTAYGLFLANSTPKLPAQAARWFRKAAEIGEAEGQYLYALALAKGEGLQEDRELAYEWALRASYNSSSKSEYEELSQMLGLSLPPQKRDLVHARSKMPLLIAVQPMASARAE